MSVALFSFAGDRTPAGLLATALRLKLDSVEVRVLPDGESLPNVGHPPATVLLYVGLDRPDAKLMPLLLACDAMRRAGVSRLVLVAPYMPYLRQDAVFSPGQPLSRDVMGGLLGPRFDRIVTVDPHLHRTRDLSPVFAQTLVGVLSAAPLVARHFAETGIDLVVGPDAESEPWVAGAAQAIGAPHLTLTKQRLGDREVNLSTPTAVEVAGRHVLLIDDICSSGATLTGALRGLREAGAASVDVAVVHALFDHHTEAALRQAGARSLISTDSCFHPTNAVRLAPLLADALSRELAT